MPPGRATTPQAQTRTRANRSASREVTASPANTRGAAGGRRRGARQASVEEAEVSASAPAAVGARRGKRGKKDAAALPPVDEDADAGVDNEEVPTDPQLESPSLLSNVSGTTAVSSTSAQPGGTDRSFDDVCYVLPHLYEAAEDLLEVLAPDNAIHDELGVIVNELKTPGSRPSLSLKRCGSSLTAQLESLTEAQYINPTVFLRSVLKSRPVSKLDASPWRPDDILFKANLATLIHRLAIQERESADTYDMLRNLDLILPSFFLSGFGATVNDQVPIGGSTMLRQTFDFALELRTQFFILQLLKSSNDDDFDANEIVNAVFFKTSDDGTVQVKGWDLPQLSDSNFVSSGYSHTILQRVDRVKSHLDEEGGANLDNLANDFTWSAFQISALDWARIRNRELNEAIEIRGGARAIVKELRRQFEPSSTKSTPLVRRSNATQGAARRRTYPATAPGQSDALDAATNKRFDSSDLALLKALGRGTQGGNYAGLPTIPPIQEPVAQPSTAPAGYRAQDDADAAFLRQQYAQDGDHYQAEADDDGYGQPTDPALLETARSLPDWTRGVLEAAAQHDRHNQENLDRARFIDRQNGAQRLEFGDGFSQAPGSATSAQRHIASSALARAGYSSGKRRAGDDSDDIDPSQDAGFQTDDRNIDFAERRRMAPPSEGRAPVAHMTGPSPRKRARFQTTYPEEGLYNDDGIEYENGNDIQQSSADMYQRAKVQARAASKNATERGLLHRPTAASGDRGVGRGAGNPGKRKWSVEQEGLLIDYIRDYGCKWAEIKKVDDATEESLLGQWSQVDLKDKAINIRVDFLKSRSGQPKNFEYISLRQLDRDKLAAMGIPVPDPVR